MDAAPPRHPTDQILIAYGLGKLEASAAAAIESHLEGCQVCRQRVSELSGDSFVGRLRAASGPAPSERAKKADGPSNPAPSPYPDLAGSLPAELADNPQYQMLRELGRGGMGVVYLARNTLMDRLEVLKVLNKEMLERNETLDRFLREIRAAARLDHPNVARAYSARQVGGLLIFDMEYIEGYDLSKLVKSRGPLPVAQACSFIHQVALGLQHAHERGMVHRDIKPANLMLTPQRDRGIVKILDFGLAKASRENSVGGGMTREGQMLGTPDYIAPEQTLDAKNADIRADIYSLGCTLYYLLAGSPPFDGKTLFDILQAHHSIDARPLNLVRPEVPVKLAAVVGKMMAKKAQRRYQTPVEVAKALTPFFKYSNSPAESPSAVDSQAGRTAANATTAATSLKTDDERRIVPPRKTTESPAAGSRSESSIDFGEAEQSNEILARAGTGKRGTIRAFLTSLSKLLRLRGIRNHLDKRSADTVDCTIFAPPDLSPGDEFVIQVFAHTDEQAQDAAKLAVLFDRDSKPRGFKSLEIEISHGSRLVFHLDLPSFLVDDPIQSLVWRGRPASAQFRVIVPIDHQLGDVVGSVAVSLNSVPVGYINFKLTVVSAGRIDKTSGRPTGESAHRFRRAFVSYASQDRNEVLKRVQMLKLARIRYFHDVLSLEPGDRWERALYRHIDKCDLFLLFWSTSAKQSEWVMEEVRYALSAKVENRWRRRRSDL